LQPFVYQAPIDLEAVLAMMSDHGPDAKLLAGGQSLLVMLRQRLLTPGLLIDIKRVTELGVMSADGAGLRIGSTVRHADLAGAAVVLARWPLLAMAAGSIGSIHIRNRGTIGGSIAHADPAADLVVALIALDARVEARTSTSTALILAEDLPVGIFETCLKPDAVVTSIQVPAPPSASTSGYSRFALRAGEFPMCQVAVRLSWSGARCSEARVAIGGAADHPLRLIGVEAALTGADLGVGADDAIEMAVAAANAEVRPFADIRGSEGWKRRVASVILHRAVRQAVEARPRTA
jgi:aerobic carbon-monoxide dehydrogenase medium subunit